MAEDFIIRRYKEDDHEAVRRIFGSGIIENYKTGIYLGLQSPRVIGILAAMFAVGSFHSLLLGICILMNFIIPENIYINHNITQFITQKHHNKVSYHNRGYMLSKSMST